MRWQSNVRCNAPLIKKIKSHPLVCNDYKKRIAYCKFELDDDVSEIDSTSFSGGVAIDDDDDDDVFRLF